MKLSAPARRNRVPGGGRRLRPIGPATDDLADDTLLAGFAGGDDALALAFVRRFQRRVYGVAFAVTGTPAVAEEVAQEAFERAWRRADTFDVRRGPVGTWLATITRNIAIDVGRVSRPTSMDPDDFRAGLMAPIGDGPEQRTLLGESTDELWAAIRTLPPEQARAIVLAGIGGLSASEVATAEQIPLGTAKTRIRTALQRLRAVLDPGSTQ